AGIPYRVARGTEFYNRKIIRDILAYLKVLANGDDDVSCLRIINTPTRGIGATTIGRLRNYAEDRNISLVEACRQGQLTELSKAPAGKVQTFAKMIDTLAGKIDKPVQELIEDVVKLSGINKSLEEKNEENKQIRSNIDELITTAAEFDNLSPGGGTLLEYLHQISLVSDVDNLDAQQGGVVTLMTLHAAKGLEFPIVFMVGCEEGLLPFSRVLTRPGSKDSAEMEEERRLAFVGITRAMDELQLSVAKRRMVRGSYICQAQSRFIDEMGTDGITLDDRSAMLQTRPAAQSYRRGSSFYKDVDTRQKIEAMDVTTSTSPFPPEYEYLRPGSKVHHRKFGQGTVMKIVGRWPETRVDVMFAGLGLKRLVLAMAPLDVEQ
ncbi:MAG TPA: ATP-dependent DNA helicase PcrA, partial [Phycisphaerae bacterium]|nr:ATP-dependent DNA helicase PcrA [Phycisphaerae bacterium]